MKNPYSPIWLGYLDNGETLLWLSHTFLPAISLYTQCHSQLSSGVQSKLKAAQQQCNVHFLFLLLSPVKSQSSVDRKTRRCAWKHKNVWLYCFCRAFVHTFHSCCVLRWLWFSTLLQSVVYQPKTQCSVISLKKEYRDFFRRTCKGYTNETMLVFNLRDKLHDSIENEYT